METIALLLCLLATSAAQLLHPISTMGMGMGMGSPLLHGGMRYPGVMQTSQLSSATYPTWKTHPIFRMAVVGEKNNVGTNLPSDVLNVAKVPTSQEVLTHMALANPNPRPYLDTMADFFYEPQKARVVMTPVVTAAAAAGAPVGSSVYTQGMNLMRATGAYGDDCGPQEGRWERGMDWLY